MLDIRGHVYLPKEFDAELHEGHLEWLDYEEFRHIGWRVIPGQPIVKLFEACINGVWYPCHIMQDAEKATYSESVWPYVHSIPGILWIVHSSVDYPNTQPVEQRG